MMDGAVTVAACHLLLHAAARATLEPLGLARIDETAAHDDHGWWVVAPDFETLRARGSRSWCPGRSGPGAPGSCCSPTSCGPRASSPRGPTPWSAIPCAAAPVV